MKFNPVQIKKMSRKEIEFLLCAIFSEYGLVKMILSFDDYTFDLIRRIIDPILFRQSNFNYTYSSCQQCQFRDWKTMLVTNPDNDHYNFTFCNAFHLELAIHRKGQALTFVYLSLDVKTAHIRRRNIITRLNSEFDYGLIRYLQRFLK